MPMGNENTLHKSHLIRSQVIPFHKGEQLQKVGTMVDQ